MKISARTLLAAMGAVGVVIAGAWSANAQQMSTWDQVHKNGVVRMGCINAEPWGFKDPKTGQWSGIQPGYAALVAEELKLKWECVETTWANGVAGLQANQFDFVAGYDATPQRALAIDFAPGVLIYYAVAVLVRKDFPAEEWKNLDSPKVKIAVPLGTSNDYAISKILTNATFERTTDAPGAIAAFASGRADAVGGSSLWVLMQNIALGNKGKVVIPKPAQAATAGVGVRREADKRWRDWLGVTLEYYYWRGSMVKVYEDFVRSRGVDPKDALPIRLEDMK